MLHQHAQTVTLLQNFATTTPLFSFAFFFLFSFFSIRLCFRFLQVVAMLAEAEEVRACFL